MPTQTHQPRSKTRRTHWRVRLADKVSGSVVRVGGIGVIFAVLGILVYLAAVVAPLFSPASTAPALSGESPITQAPLFIDTDEYGAQFFAVTPDGVLTAVALDGSDDVLLTKRVIPEGRTITAFSRGPRFGQTAFGYDDGTIQFGKVGFESRFVQVADDPVLAALGVGERMAYEGGVAERVDEVNARVVGAVVQLPDPTPVKSGSGAIKAIDYTVNPTGELVVVVREDGTAVFEAVRIVRPLGGGAPRISLTDFIIPFQEPYPGSGPPDWMFVTADSTSVLAVWREGVCQRYGSADREHIFLAETVRLTPEGVSVTSCRMILGALTMIVGDDRGHVSAWFTARDNLSESPDLLTWSRGHDLGAANATGAPVSSFGISDRDRVVVIGDERGGLQVRHVTSHKHVAQLDTGIGSAIVGSLVTPKLDGVLALGADGRWTTWTMNVGHPEATFQSLFGKVWYEGEPGPAFVYQSSSGDDAAEVKYNITPLIFGSLKSTVYAMLFAAPLAILAAIFTSEFLHPRVRTYVKPVVEVMASLPSVVLGFVAALVIAPWIADRVPGLLLAFVTVPIGALLAGLIWQCVPVRIATRLTTGVRLTALIVIVSGAMGGAVTMGPLVERALFRPSATDVLALAGSVEPLPRDQWPAWVGEHRQTLGPDDARRLKNEGLFFQNGSVVRPVGDISDPVIAARIAEDNLDRASIIQWLNGVIGTPFPGWIVLAFPFSVIALAALRTALIEPWLRSYSAGLSRAGAGALELVKFFVVIGGAAAISFAIAGLLTGLGLDARDSVMGAFTPRNSLVVGIAMGFAVIPIIYTISEDALASVPDSLRSASLGSGATRWQTAIRVIVPVAMSGIFSALMIGLGRAVGETMIVLMATGNTPEMEWNIFSGFRALSANIAVELPEAPKDSTHYRVLFLCGLTLFAMTFIINTFAELVRQRFRKRSASL